MASYDHDFIYCSPFLPIASLDEQLGDRRSPLYAYPDPADSPEMLLLKKMDRRRLRRWLRELPAPLSVVARGLLRGETQASMSRKLGISEPAVKKRIGRLSEIGKRRLRDLRHSPLLS